MQLLPATVQISCTEETCRCTIEWVHRGVHRTSAGLLFFDLRVDEDRCATCRHAWAQHIVAKEQPDPKEFTNFDRMLLRKMAIAERPAWMPLYEPPEVG